MKMSGEKCVLLLVCPILSVSPSSFSVSLSLSLSFFLSLYVRIMSVCVCAVRVNKVSKLLLRISEKNQYRNCIMIKVFLGSKLLERQGWNQLKQE